MGLTNCKDPDVVPKILRHLDSRSMSPEVLAESKIASVVGDLRTNTTPKVSFIAQALLEKRCNTQGKRMVDTLTASRPQVLFGNDTPKPSNTFANPAAPAPILLTTEEVYSLRHTLNQYIREPQQCNRVILALQQLSDRPISLRSPGVHDHISHDALTAVKSPLRDPRYGKAVVGEVAQRSTAARRFPVFTNSIRWLVW